MMKGCTPSEMHAARRALRSQPGRRAAARLAVAVSVAVGCLAWQAPWAYTAPEAAWGRLQGNPEGWRDYRALKKEGAVHPRHPDFKHLETGEALWVDSYSAPDWARAAEFDGVPAAASARRTPAAPDPLWESLAANPQDWLDHRARKKAGALRSKHPDFTKPATRQALWVDNARAPAWAPTADLNVPMDEGRSVRPEDPAWRSAFLDAPHEWTDHRQAKESGAVSPRFPDLKRPSDDKSLWLESAPGWVAEQLASGGAPAWQRAEAPRPTETDDEHWRSLFDEPAEWVDYRAGKASGDLKPGHPDFKKGPGMDSPSLWLTGRGTPSWARERVSELGAAAPWQQFGDSSDKKERLWFSLFEEPDDWVDYREEKLAGKVKEGHPDFKRLSGDDALWVNNRDTPDWVDEELAAVDSEIAAERQESQDAPQAEVTVVEERLSVFDEVVPETRR